MTKQEELHIGDIRISSSKKSLPELVKIARELLKSREVIDYLTKLKEQRVSGSGYFG